MIRQVSGGKLLAGILLGLLMANRLAAQAANASPEPDDFIFRRDQLGPDPGDSLVLGNGSLTALVEVAEGRIIVRLFLKELASPLPPHCPRECGQVVIALAEGGGAGSSAARLDMRKGAAFIQGVPGKCSAAEIRVTAEGDGIQIITEGEVTIQPPGSPDLPPAETGTHERGEWFKQAIPSNDGGEGVDYSVALAKFIPRKAFATAWGVGVVSSRRSGDVAADATGVASARFLAKRERLIQIHEREWEKFWKGIDLPKDADRSRAAAILEAYLVRCTGMNAGDRAACGLGGKSN